MSLPLPPKGSQFSLDFLTPFSVVTLSTITFLDVTLQEIHLISLWPFYTVLSNITFPLHRHTKPFTTNRGLLPPWDPPVGGGLPQL